MTKANEAPLLNVAYMGKDRAEALQPDPDPVIEAKEEDVQDDTKPGETVDWENRYSNLRSHQAKKEQELRDTIAQLERDKAATPAWTPPVDAEGLAEFKKEHPEVANIFETIAHDRAQEAMEETRRYKAEVDELREENARATALNVVIQKYPDYETILASAEFQDWFPTQPETIQKWVTDNVTDGALAVRVMDLFASDTGYKPKKKPSKEKLKVDASLLVDSKETPLDIGEETPDTKIWTAKDIKAISQSDWDDNVGGIVDIISKANEEGRIQN